MHSKLLKLTFHQLAFVLIKLWADAVDRIGLLYALCCVEADRGLRRICGLPERTKIRATGHLSHFFVVIVIILLALLLGTLIVVISESYLWLCSHI